ncbi:MAG: putative toxin-antitoxin system toxin component, PIN family [Candidatus Poribacteria bacterium]|nr:putative toxin-antitoxin system toxin component, PIN family [Candidatus Poribacteria bacterium]
MRTVPNSVNVVKVVVDTNIVVSGYLWTGAPHQVIELRRTNQIVLYTSGVLMAELLRVMRRDKFMERLDKIAMTIDRVVADYQKITRNVTPAVIPPTILADPTDAAVLACAKAANADFIVTGDPHLLAFGSYGDAVILEARTLLDRLTNNPT